MNSRARSLARFLAQMLSALSPTAILIKERERISRFMSFLPLKVYHGAVAVFFTRRSSPLRCCCCCCCCFPNRIFRCRSTWWSFSFCLLFAAHFYLFSSDAADKMKLSFASSCIFFLLLSPLWREPDLRKIRFGCAHYLVKKLKKCQRHFCQKVCLLPACHICSGW